MDRRISATEAARTFSHLLDRIRYRGESFVVERAGVAICRISPAAGSGGTVEDLVRILESTPAPDAAYLTLVEKHSKKQPLLPKLKWPR